MPKSKFQEVIFTIIMVFKTKRANVVVLIPPAVPIDEPPINIKNIQIKAV